MRECHGKRRCVLAADSELFGKPCRAGSRTYLKVVYTCVKLLAEYGIFYALPGRARGCGIGNGNRKLTSA
ncbi:hypothetical protein EVAR_50699_1 [Eumeta japonica]|uniref:SUEL-type lectin domain-containing protein n=1 Tax=Eumeta variegata TaxID=151549 RepID=A0A4C1YS11_EUMVA|nr:hypothetical protein EVAR_50699_1 [Eumeta japonica]